MANFFAKTLVNRSQTLSISWFGLFWSFFGLSPSGSTSETQFPLFGWLSSTAQSSVPLIFMAITKLSYIKRGSLIVVLKIYYDTMISILYSTHTMIISSILGQWLDFNTIVYLTQSVKRFILLDDNWPLASCRYSYRLLESRRNRLRNFLSNVKSSFSNSFLIRHNEALVWRSIFSSNSFNSTFHAFIICRGIGPNLLNNLKEILCIIYCAHPDEVA